MSIITDRGFLFGKGGGLYFLQKYFLINCFTSSLGIEIGKEFGIEVCVSAAWHGNLFRSLRNEPFLMFHYNVLRDLLTRLNIVVT